MNAWKTTLCGGLAAVFAALQAHDLNALNLKTGAAIACGALVAYFAADHQEKEL